MCEDDVASKRLHVAGGWLLARLALGARRRLDAGDDAACRSDPTFTRASPGLAVAEQLPQIIIIIIKIRRPNGEALENFPPAEGRPVGGVQGGQRPPAQHYSIIIIIIIIIKRLYKARKQAGYCTGVQATGHPPSTRDTDSPVAVRSHYLH